MVKLGLRILDLGLGLGLDNKIVKQLSDITTIKPIAFSLSFQFEPQR